ncbi:MAG: translation elongation factor Ts, partial [Lachnospiraceae bacterium]|nr:translation elongation factor Ts [Lachnospiraceae bacterium]
NRALASGLNGGKDGEDVQTLLERGLQEVVAEKTLQIGEKLSFRRFEKVTGDEVASYIHGGGKIGVLVAAEGASGDAVKEALTNVAMQIAAMNPEYISRNDISEEESVKLKEIIIDSALNDPFTLPKPILQKLIEKAIVEKTWTEEDIAIYEEKKSNMNYLPNFLSDAAKAVLANHAMEGKSDYLADKIFGGLVDGRISKHMKEICLLDQVYVKAEDGKQSVGQYLKSVDANINITKFVRFEVGEGMEKKNEDFAAEVAKQMNG